ncbi:hypothetical protein IT412_00715 [Candidatus Peregrinibacteria bacterium]|nr:hypothetical protein [Candidatus Peregrinibacteria bacterium]
MIKKRLGLLEKTHQHHAGCEHGHNHHEVRPEVSVPRKEVRTKAMLVLGPLGSGKTSLVKWVLSRNGKVLGKLRLIINDVGKEKVDADRLTGDLDLAGEDLISLQSGCICCEDLESLREAVKGLDGKIDTVVIEPTGIAEGEAITEMLEKMHLPVATITLMDVLHHSKRSAAEQLVIDTQLSVADVIGLTWWEGASEEQIDVVLDYIGARKNRSGKKINVPVIKLPKRHFGQTEIIGDDSSASYDELFRIVIEKSKKHHGHQDHQHDEHEHDHVHAEKAPVFSMTFDDLPENFSEEDLARVLAKYESVLIRAKGVVNGRRFNYVWGSLNWEVADSGKARLNFITSEPVDEEKVGLELRVVAKKDRPEMTAAYACQIEQFITNYLKMNKIELREYTEKEIDKLIGMYKEWMEMDKEIKAWSESAEDQFKISARQIEQKALGEAMTFANPLIWLGYKIRAYAGSSKELRTVADLRKHAENPDYICYKRLSYLSDALKAKTGKDLWKDWSAETQLEELFNNEVWWELSADANFIGGWQNYEYFRQVDGDRMRVAKWENWQRA